MDYKYIEQLLERYWQCLTTVEEERILRSFFMQQDIPSHLKPYAYLFLAQEEIAKEHLGEDFDKRLLAIVGEEEEEENVVKIRPVSFWQRLRPLYQAAGLVALMITIGTAAQRSFGDSAEDTDAPQYAESGIENEADVTANPTQQSAALKTDAADTLEYTR